MKHPFNPSRRCVVRKSTDFDPPTDPTGPDAQGLFDTGAHFRVSLAAANSRVLLGFR